MTEAKYYGYSDKQPNILAEQEAIFDHCTFTDV